MRRRRPPTALPLLAALLVACEVPGEALFECRPGAIRACAAGPAATRGVGQCRAGTETCGDDGFWTGDCAGAVTPVPEACTGVDDDCDGQVDEGDACDDRCAAGETRPCYDGPPGTLGVGGCLAGVESCGTGGRWRGVCASAVVPRAEACDGVDDDCDGAVDNHAACGDDARRRLADEVGPLWIRSRPGRPGPSLLTPAGWGVLHRCAPDQSAEACADALLTRASAAFGLDDPTRQLAHVHTRALGASRYVVYRQIHRRGADAEPVPVDSGGLVVRWTDGRIVHVESHLVVVRRDVPAQPGRPFEVEWLPSGARLADSGLAVSPRDEAAALEATAYDLLWQGVYVLGDDVRRATFDARSGERLADRSALAFDLDLTLSTEDQAPRAQRPGAAGAPQQTWDILVDFHAFADDAALPADGADLGDSLVRDPLHPDAGELHVHLSDLTDRSACGVACPECGDWTEWSDADPRAFAIDPDCVGAHTLAHEAAHVLFGPYLQARRSRPHEEAIEHALVDLTALAFECQRRDPTARSCDWTSTYGAYRDAPDVSRFCDLARPTATMQCNGIAAPEDYQRTGNKRVFGGPAVRAFDAWGGDAAALRRLQRLHTASALTLGSIRTVSLTEFALHTLAVCHDLAQQGGWDVATEHCQIYRQVYADAGILPPCVFPLDRELCNGIDDNCDGLVDNCVDPAACCAARTAAGDPGACDPLEQSQRDDTLSRTRYAEGVPALDPATAGVGLCRPGYDVCEDGRWRTVVEPRRPTNELCDVAPAGTEPADENCDGRANDEAVRVAWLVDRDGDGVGARDSETLLCADAAPVGMVRDDGRRDCDDDDPTAFPRRIALVEGDEPARCQGPNEPPVDEDCDGLFDEGCPCDPGAAARQCGGSAEACQTGQQACDALAGGGGRWSSTCRGVGPTDDETCNGLDDDCDGRVDEQPGDIDPQATCRAATGVGQCARGRWVCVAGDRICVASVPTDEACDDRDLDCNGLPGHLDALQAHDADGDGHPGDTYPATCRRDHPRPLDCADDDPRIGPCDAPND